MALLYFRSPLTSTFYQTNDRNKTQEPVLKTSLTVIFSYNLRGKRTLPSICGRGEWAGDASSTTKRHSFESNGGV